MKICQTYNLSCLLRFSKDPIADPGLIRTHVDSLCQTACMVDFAAFDTSVPRGGGSVLLGRSGVELWVGEYCTTAPFMTPGQRYGSENKVRRGWEDVLDGFSGD